MSVCHISNLLTIDMCIHDSSTHMSPFEVVYGFNPLTPTDLLPLPCNEHLNVNGRDRARMIKEMHEKVKQIWKRHPLPMLSMPIGDGKN